ncbi:MAG TPA: FHA domain-containing protein, partial [Thermomicrobiales bacterium]
MSAPFRLRVESGPNAGQTFTLDSAGTTIGRQDGNTIVLDDGRLSRQHARIDLGSTGLTLTDLGSANGTKINGQRVSGTQPLRIGDQLQLGETTIVVEGGATAMPTGRPTAPVHRAAAATTPLGSMSGAATPRLILESDGRIFPLDQASTVIGRQAGNAITLTDTQASRQHARIEVRSGQLTVTDLGSANGTRVNGALIGAPTTLRDGDQLQIGTSLFRVEARSATRAETDDAGATVHSAPPRIAAPPPFGAVPSSGTAPLPPLSSPPPPQFAPGTPAWGAPAAAPYGAPPPPLGQVGMPPPAARAGRSGVPLILGGLAALVLLLCLVGGVGGALLLRSRAEVTPTPASGAISGTAVVGGGNLPTPTGATPGFPGGGNNPGTFPGGGGNPAPPAPSAAPAPTLAPLAPTIAPTIVPTIAATAPGATPTPQRPTT